MRKLLSGSVGACQISTAAVFQLWDLQLESGLSSKQTSFGNKNWFHVGRWMLFFPKLYFWRRTSESSCCSSRIGSRLKPSCKASCRERSAIIISLSCLMLHGIMSFQGRKKPKQKPVASVQSEVEGVELKESVALGQEPPRPAVRKRRRQRHKVAERSQKVRNVSPLCVIKGFVSWHVRTTFSTVLRPSSLTKVTKF